MTGQLSDLLRRARGRDAPFRQVHWILGVLGLAVVWGVGELQLPAIHDSALLDYASAFILAGYVVWAGVLMWRCASNVTGLWVYLAPIYAACWVLGGIMLFAAFVWLALAALGVPVGLEPPD